MCVNFQLGDGELAGGVNRHPLDQDIRSSFRFSWAHREFQDLLTTRIELTNNVCWFETVLGSFYFVKDADPIGEIYVAGFARPRAPSRCLLVPPRST